MIAANDKMKVSDLIAKTLEQLDIRHAFGMVGAGNVHLFEAIAKRGFTEIICIHHEQAATMATAAAARPATPAAAAAPAAPHEQGPRARTVPGTSDKRRARRTAPGAWPAGSRARLRGCAAAGEPRASLFQRV